MRIILLECSMDLRRTLRYKVGILSDLVIFTALLLVFLYSNTGASFQEEYRTENGKALLLLGYTAWTLASTAISVTSQQIHTEVQRGTFYLKLRPSASAPLSGRFLIRRHPADRSDLCLYISRSDYFSGKLWAQLGDRVFAAPGKPRHVWDGFARCGDSPPL